MVILFRLIASKLSWPALAVAAGAQLGGCDCAARGADPDRAARVAAALADADPPPARSPVPCDAACRVRVALALAAEPAAPTAAAAADPCCGCKTAPGGKGTCGSFACPANGGAGPCPCAAPKPMPPGDPPAPKWRADYAAAMAEAARDRKPVFCVVGDPVGCIDCKRLEAGALRNKDVLADLDRFVPVLVNAKAEPELARQLGAARWPHVIVADPDGKILTTHTGLIGAAALQEKLRGKK
jgi:hypothetical protein